MEGAGTILILAGVAVARIHRIINPLQRLNLVKFLANSSTSLFMQKPDHYRPDIDGLRAIAVIAVLWFHVSPRSLPGGFVGVDIFFVISGFLISGIIFQDIQNKKFSFTSFYARRIRRIFPALILVLLACSVFGWFYLLAQEYAALGKHAAAGAGFIANFIFWNEAGYFDIAANTKPLLHLWSLGIEEQFYIFWPLLIWFGTRWRANVLWLLAGLAAVSFYLNISAATSHPTATFYSPQTRAWELLAGSALAWFSLHHQALWQNISKTGSNWLSGTGIALLLYSFFAFNTDLAFPGIWAALPVVGTALLIMAGSQCWLNRHLLANRIAVWFGLISFPLYLWHWPLLSFAWIIEGGKPEQFTRYMLLALSVLLAWLTYRFVEHYLRHSRSRLLPLSLSVVMTVLGTFGLLIYGKDGLPERIYHQQVAPYADSIKITSRKKECFDIPYAYHKTGDWYCHLGNPEHPSSIFLAGDSHALSLLPAFEKYAATRKINILFAGMSVCPSLLDIQPIRGDKNIEQYNCPLLHERIFNFIKEENIKNIVLVNRWSHYTKTVSRSNEFNPVSSNQKNADITTESSIRDFAWSIEHTVRRYRSLGVKVFLVADNPQQLYSPKNTVRKTRWGEENYLSLSVSTAEHFEHQQAVNTILQQTAETGGGGLHQF